MKKIYCLAILIGLHIYVQAQSRHLVNLGETFVTIANKYGISEKELRKANEGIKQCYVGITLNIPNIVLHSDIPDIASFYVKQGDIPAYMGEIYNKGLRFIISGEDKKAYHYFRKIARHRNNRYCAEDKEHAHYQLAHYETFGFYDKYYNGTPSDIDRSRINTSILKKEGFSFNETNDKTRLLMQANPSWVSYNLQSVVSYGVDFLISSKSNDVKFAKSIFYSACSPDLENKKNLYEYITFFGTITKYDFQKVLQLVKVLPYISQMKQSNIVEDIGKSGVELYELGNAAYSKGDVNKAFYFYCRAALEGNYQAYINIYKSAYQSYILSDLYDCDNLYDNRRIMDHMKDIATAIYECAELEMFKIISEVFVSTYNDEYDKINNVIRQNERIARAEQEARRQQRLQAAANILQGVGQVMVSSMNQMAMQQQLNAMNYQVPTMANVGNMNYLLDPRFAVAQVNAQEEIQYQSARQGYQQMTGRDLSKNEWRAMQGQAIQNMKNEGFDIIAEQKRIYEDNKTFEQELRQEEQEQRIEKNKAILEGTPYNSQTKRAGEIEVVKTSTENKPLDRNEMMEYDSKEEKNSDDNKQIYTEESSENYIFDKRITIYNRVNGKNNVRFKSKDLYKKGANYYVEIDGKYIHAIHDSNYGFNYFIPYNGVFLYFSR